MHRYFTSLLQTAVGSSEHVIVVFGDIRGFSAFSSQNDSQNVATYVRSLYATLVDSYFPDASFYKPTGDGLLIVYRFDSQTLTSRSEYVVGAALRCVADFPEICATDAMINFDVPTAIGFGIARGSACRLHADDRTIDYSGKLLNLAARITSIARPKGVVVDKAFGSKQLPSGVRDEFREVPVFLRGIAEAKPVVVLAHSEVTDIPVENLRSMKSKWKTKVAKIKCSQLFIDPPRIQCSIPEQPLEDSVSVAAEYGRYIDGELDKTQTLGVQLVRGVDWEYRQRADEYLVWLHATEVQKRIGANSLPEDAEIKIMIKYESC